MANYACLVLRRCALVRQMKSFIATATLSFGVSDLELMNKLYDRLTRIALNLANPYVHGTGAAPSGRVWPYLRSHLHPLRWVLVLSVLVTTVAASLEVWLISYAGQLIDMLADTTPAEIWQHHSTSLTWAAVMVVLIRPLSEFTRRSVNDIALQCNAANLFRWRAHDHLTQQSVGWFQEDLAGRTASRLVLIGNYAMDVIYHSLNAVAFGLVYMIGVVTLMAGTDIRLAFPLFIWLALYITLMVMIVPRMVKSMETFMASKSALLGGVVDTFSNFDTISLFAQRKDIEADHHKWLEKTRQTLFLARQISVGMRTVTVWLEGVIIVGFVGYGIWLWSQGSASIGLVSAAVALSLRIATMADWVSEAVWSIFQQVGSVREAKAHEFITELQDSKGRTGYATHVGERGVKLSGGQRQRIALARVILKDAPILILDEATSALDSEVEAEVQSALQQVMRDKTVIAIAHRLSTIAEMDRIVVLNDGRIVESGTHAELLAAGNLYATLWSGQSGGFIGAADNNTK